jgi:hypothetical protein
MLDEAVLEQRLATIEHAVTDLQNRFDAALSANNWLDTVAGSVSDEVAFLEALEYGRAIRHSDRPTTPELGEQS